MIDFRRSILGLSAMLALASCTFSPGEPWGWVDAELTVYPVASSGDVEIDTQSIELRAIDVRAPAASTEAVNEFDPANPPPGYSLCHGGHCHADDGSLVDYEEIEAGLDDDGPVSVATAFIEEPRDLNEAQTIPTSFRIVEEVSLTEVAVTVDEIVLEGTVERDDETYSLEMELTNFPSRLTTDILVDVNRDSPVSQDLALELRWSETLFDDLPELDAALDDASENAIEISDEQHPEIAEKLTQRIIEDARLTVRD